jgi:TrpR family trp operon transcriptional repressor
MEDGCGARSTLFSRLTASGLPPIFITMSDSNTIDIPGELGEISRALGSVQDPELIKDFLFCLLTPYEIEEVASRWALVKMMDRGASQRNIAAELGLSLCKITRGSRELKKKNSAFKRFIDISGEIERTAAV